MTTHQQLLKAVADLEDNGLIVPCREPAVRDWWTSEDLEEQQAAAYRCGPCPLIAECRAYGIAWPREIGVYGGLTEKQRRTAARTNGDAA